MSTITLDKQVGGNDSIKVFISIESSQFEREEEEKERDQKMNRNLSSLLIGLVGAAITLSAYSQTWISPTECITVGLLVLIFGLLVNEGLISL
ncbi:uncharacterized protein LOC111025520 [Momordica charantia]|uniref:Uncharacterized protein LOC111025520 n=1 Tax=Momordica charantia TaxID=3673 RepID=A0A6J1DXU0_MOMCH|nr:uncharacterized protein LOC111025520 [Momordica charantia]